MLEVDMINADLKRLRIKYGWLFNRYCPKCKREFGMPIHLGSHGHIRHGTPPQCPFCGADIAAVAVSELSD